MTVISGKLTRVRTRRVEFVESAAVDGPRLVSRRPAKVARMLALAHHIQNAIDRGLVADRAAVARKLGFTRARVTQLLDLTLLAPEIQEVVLGLEAVDGVEPMSERGLRGLRPVMNWGMQREFWGLAIRQRSAIPGVNSSSPSDLLAGKAERSSALDPCLRARPTGPRTLILARRQSRVASGTCAQANSNLEGPTVLAGEAFVTFDL